VRKQTRMFPCRYNRPLHVLNHAISRRLNQIVVCETKDIGRELFKAHMDDADLEGISVISTRTCVSVLGISSLSMEFQ
jgi:hypothetical protein